MKLRNILLAAVLVAGFTACSDDDPEITYADYTDVEGATPDKKGPVAGFYVLNEGNLGANKCTLDYFSYADARYVRNLYAEANPNEILELGDAGNDIAVHDGRLYVVVNGSHKVEVLDARTAKRIGKVDVNSPRNIAFDGNNAYVTSFVGGDGDNGSVVRFDINTLKVTGSVSVGLCPEGIVALDGKLYVANSQNYGIGKFDNTISVVDINTFAFESSLTVGCNLRTLAKDSHDNLWVVSQGNYADIPSDLYKLPREGKSFGTPVSVGVPCSNFAIAGDKVYYYATVYDANWNPTQQYGVVDIATAKATGTDFITDGTQKDIQTPYCLAIQPANGDIFIADARNYTSSGRLFCYSPEGKLRWSVNTGDIPGHIAFVMR